MQYYVLNVKSLRLFKYMYYENILCKIFFKLEVESYI